MLAVKYRLKYTKLDKMRYIGHLDLIHIFQRAIKRANLPIAFSHGFNPHQQMGFALPLPLGMESYGEYFELELEQQNEPEDIARSLNICLPDGFNIIGAYQLEANEKPAAALITAASYEIIITAESDIDRIIENINMIPEQQTITVLKKTKSTLKDVNIRPNIHNISVLNNSVKNQCVIKTVLSAGNDGHLKPNLLVDYILNQSDACQDNVKIKYTRLDLLMEKDNAFEPLMTNPLIK